MARKKVTFLQEVSILLKLSIFLAKLKNPMIPKFKNLKHFKSYNHYSYVKDYEFSPSNTPLIKFYRTPKSERISLRKVRSHFIYLSKCFGLSKGDGKNGSCFREMGLETLPYGSEKVMRSLTEYSGFERETVDERAERFIQRFYEDMRRQRQDSHLQLNAILDV